MKKLQLFFWALACTALITGTSMTITSCGSDSNSSSSTTTSYAGPGSAYSVSFNSTGSTFTITRKDSVNGTTDLTVNGTFSDLSTSGFKLLTVTSATGTEAPSSGDQAIGLEVPGFVFLLKPLGGDSSIIPMVTAGSCPTSTLNLNWVNTTSDQAPNSASNEFYGTFTYQTNGSSEVTADYNLVNHTSVGNGSSMTGTCSEGILTVSEDQGGGGTIWLSASGAALVQTSNGNVITAMPQQTLSAADFDGDYTGLLFNENAASGSKQQTIYATISNSGTSGSGGTWANISTGTKEAASITLSSFNYNNPATGFITMTATEGSNNGNMACQAATNVNSSGKNMIFCAAQAPDDNSKFYSLLLISN